MNLKEKINLFGMAQKSFRDMYMNFDEEVRMIGISNTEVQLSFKGNGQSEFVRIYGLPSVVDLGEYIQWVWLIDGVKFCTLIKQEEINTQAKEIANA